MQDKTLRFVELHREECIYRYIGDGGRGERAGERGSCFRDLFLPKNFVMRPLNPANTEKLDITELNGDISFLDYE